MSYSPQAFNTATSTSLGEVKIGSGFTLAGDGTLNNGGVTQLTGAPTIKVSGATGSITLTDVGVLSITGTTNQVTASASTGAVTLSLPQSIATTNDVRFQTLTTTNTLSAGGPINGYNGLTVTGGTTSLQGTSITSATSATNTQSGAFQVVGGVGIGGNTFIGAGATAARFPGAQVVISAVTANQINETATNIGVMGEAVGSGSNYGVGVYGAGYTTGALRGTGVTGEGHVVATGDTASAIGVRGYANDTHAGGFNIGLYGDATSSGTGNYALYLNNGGIYNNFALTWTMNASLTFSGNAVTVSNLTATNLTVNSSLETYTSPSISANAVTLNFNNGNTFALASNAANITANYTNVTTATGQIIATALVITQGATAYIPSAVTINAVSQTLKWQGGSPPTGNANKTDIVSFTFVCNGTTTPTVLGSLSTYG
jgi:hypothetical protein